MYKKILKIGIFIFAIYALCFTLWQFAMLESKLAFAQSIELACNAPLMSIGSQFDIRNPSTGRIRQYFCIDSNGILLIQNSATQSFQGHCAGAIANGAGIETLVGLGGIPSTGTCNASSGSLLIPVWKTCTMQNLFGKSVTGGLDASDGIVTLFKNGSSTVLTFTFGTATAGQDTTHQVAFTAGDTMFVRITTDSVNLSNIVVTASCQ